jgi:hypothetical protein
MRYGMFSLALALWITGLTGGAGCGDEEPPPPPPTTSSGTQPTPSPSPQPAPRVDGGISPGDAGALDAGPTTCGGFGEICCPSGPACALEFSHCDTELALCVACGSGGQSCCMEGPACQGPLLCSAGLCSP